MREIILWLTKWKSTSLRIVALKDVRVAEGAVGRLPLGAPGF